MFFFLFFKLSGVYKLLLWSVNLLKRRRSRGRMKSGSSVSESEETIQGIPIHDGKYTKYNVCGNLFVLSSKYVPPIRLIGSGAYGIVW